ncbi:PTS system, beta-glucoside-specific IIA, IIB, and IIC component [Enterococcus sp. HSIEG1]|nr:PTS system, beta-glucoside-specific IIA, IIB, and IIC component [Enterococcus sp. HSIEG1]
MIKGLMAGLVALNVISNQTDTYLVIDMIASGVFTFLPFLLLLLLRASLKRINTWRSPLLQHYNFQR